MRNKIICAVFILLEILVCESRETSLSKKTDGYNLYERPYEGTKARRRKRENGMADADVPGSDSGAATAAEKGTLVTIIITHERETFSGE